MKFNKQKGGYRVRNKINNLKLQQQGSIQTGSHFLQIVSSIALNQKPSVVNFLKSKLKQVKREKGMNPLINNNSKYYQQSLSFMDQIRDKTKSHLQPVNVNSHYTPQYNQPYQPLIVENSNLNNMSNINNLHNNSFVSQPLANNYSQRYKSYYTDHNYPHDKSREKLNPKYQPNTIKSNYTKYNQNHQYDRINLHQNLHHNKSTIFPHSPSLKEEKSLQRKRFLTTVTPKSPDHSSSSMINPKQYIRQSKEPYQFAAHKLSISKVDNNNFPNNQQKSREKRLFTETNKKISLKRDIISPRYQQFQKNKKQSLIQQRTKLDQGIFQKTYSDQLLNGKDSFIDNTFKKRGNYYFQGQSQLMKMEKLSLQQIDPVMKNKLIQKQKFFDEREKKNEQKVRKSIMAQSQVNSFLQNKSLLIENKNPLIQNKDQNVKRQTQQKIIKDKIEQSSPQSAKLKHSNNLMIDNDIYQDMKISRIEQSTLGLQQKYQQVQKVLQKLKKSQKQHQQQINLLKTLLLQGNGNVSQSSIPNTNRTMRTQPNNNNQQSDYNHDLKRIKKQLKIIKNNFQLAFTSMTEQINRKLVKQQQIMKNLSQQIKMVATQNVKLSQSIEQKQSKVKQLQKSMTSFMQQNQQRIQNLVLLNDSFSSSANKRNRNNHSSFQYGLELKNMSADQGYMSSRQKQAVQGLRNKVDFLQKEIKKMKVYHMEQKQGSTSRVNEIKLNINQLKVEVDKIKSQKDTNRLVSLVSEMIVERVPLLIQPQTSLMKDKILSLQQQVSNNIKQMTESLSQMKKSVNEQLYEFRLGKLYPRQSGDNQWGSKLSNNTMNISDRQLNSIKDRVYSIEQRVSVYDKKLNNIQQKQFHIVKSQQQQKLKELKHSGDIRQVQQSIKQIHLRTTEYITSDKLNTALETMTLSIRQFITNIDSQIVEINRINSIQTQNIQSINSQFQRVINKQIIPKFQQIHNNNLQLQRKLTIVKNSIRDKEKEDKLSTQRVFNSNNNNGVNNMDDDKTIQNKVQLYVNQNINKFLNNKVKLFSTKVISNKSPLTKLGLASYNNNKYNPNNSSLSSSTVLDTDSEVDKENTYLIDQNGYLMDWQGYYLMEVLNDGTRNKIKVTQKQIYFMQVNGINVTQVNQFI